MSNETEIYILFSNKGNLHETSALLSSDFSLSKETKNYNKKNVSIYRKCLDVPR